MQDFDVSVVEPHRKLVTFLHLSAAYHVLNILCISGIWYNMKWCIRNRKKVQDREFAVQFEVLCNCITVF
jgi:hypothetical protein